jgi:hypothetical protein
MAGTGTTKHPGNPEKVLTLSGVWNDSRAASRWARDSLPHLQPTILAVSRAAIFPRSKAHSPPSRQRPPRPSHTRSHRSAQARSHGRGVAEPGLQANGTSALAQPHSQPSPRTRAQAPWCTAMAAAWPSQCYKAIPHSAANLAPSRTPGRPPALAAECLAPCLPAPRAAPLQLCRKKLSVVGCFHAQASAEWSDVFLF